DSLTSEPISGVNVTLGKERFISNKNGIFEFRHPKEKSTLKISAIGYNTQFYEIDKYVSSLIIKLNTSVSAIEEVMVSTGYYSLPMERSTGSFTQISKDDLEKRPGKNILER